MMETLATPNRAQRRAALKSRKLQTRARQPRLIMANAMDVVKSRAARLTDAERANVMLPAKSGFKALREGVATLGQWQAVSSAVSVARAIEAQGIVRGIHEHLAAADCALDAVWHRVQDGVRGSAWGRCTTLYFDEIAALETALFLHDHQLQQLALSEFHSAVELARRDVRAAGGTEVPTPTHLPSPTQERLL
jgi:hypothetical protein